MKKTIKFFLVMIFLSFFIFGCSRGPSTGQNPASQLVSNEGLVVELNFRDDFLPLIEYELILTNRGATSITLSRENLNLYTIEKMSSANQDVLTKESLENFYSQILQDSSNLMLGAQQKRVIKGSFLIEDDYYLNSINSQVNILLNIDYDYKTNFTTNLILDLENKRVNTDRVIQAAPVIIENIDLLIVDQERQRLLFDIKNKGTANSLEIKNPSFFLGQNNLNCLFFGVTQNGMEQDIMSISRRYSHLRVSCEIPSSYLNDLSQSRINTLFYGSFEYIYSLSFSQRFTLPKQREVLFV